MQPNELTAVLSRTNEVAVYPAHIEADLPYYVNSRTGRNSRRSGILYCPSGMVRGRVLENGTQWIEKRQIVVCGDQDYEIQRRNGVLIEFDLADLPADVLKIKGKRVFRADAPKVPYPHSEVVTHDGQKFIHMIVSRKAIVAPWDEYSMEIARQEKEESERQAKYNRLRDAQSVLMGLDETPEFWNTKEFRNRWGYLGADYEKIRYDAESGDRLPESEYKEVGHIELTIDQAELIISLLSRNQRKMLKAAHAES